MSRVPFTRNTDVGSVGTGSQTYLGISDTSIILHIYILATHVFDTLFSQPVMNNTKETLSSVKDVIPDIGGNFQLDPAVIESKELKLKPNKPIDEAELYQSSRKELRFSEQAAMEPHFGRGLLK